MHYHGQAPGQTNTHRWWAKRTTPDVGGAVRAQLPKAACLEAFPHLVRLLGAEANVLHSYAAIAIDRMLSQKVRATRQIVGVMCVQTVRSFCTC